MSECLVCDMAFFDDDEDTSITACDGDEYGVCADCRADAALGRAVRRMPEGSQVMRSYDGSFYAGKYSGLPLQGVSPEAALEAAGLMEVKE